MTLLEAVHTQRVLADFGADQAKMVRAAEYTDKWFTTEGRDFRAHYMCLAGGAGTECGTMTRRDVWMRPRHDMLAKRQRFVCPVCRARYRTRFGVMCKLILKRTSTYTLADLPSSGLGDAKAMATQARCRNVRTGEELLAAIPRARPLDAGVYLTPVTHCADGRPLQPHDVYRFPVGVSSTTG